MAAITETRTFVGETASAVFDGYAGFRIGRAYPLTFERRTDVTVDIVLDHHAHVTPGAGPLVVREAQFEKWWVR